ncbi:MAG: TrkA C-terminal domain-containing protein [Candidatus Omnitrophota bacterium]
MNMLLFFIALIVSFIIVRIGAIAFELTGLDWSMATFQSLSCFTGTGFTTKESELVTNNPSRRRIASVLIVLGHAGFVTLIATFANSLRSFGLNQKLKTLWLPIHVPEIIIPWINITIIFIAIFASYRIGVYTKFDRKLTSLLRSRIVKNEIIKRVSFEELVVATGGYGISQIEIGPECSIIDKTLMNSELRSADITVLAIQREGTIIPNPSAHTRISLEDKLICFGKLENIRNKICVIPKEKNKT